jgi:hypothetical protein
MGMERFNLNVARAFVGRHVNLHLKDGSVVVNVYVSDAKHHDENGKPTVYYKAKPRTSPSIIHLKEVEWIEQLNPFVLN